MSEGYEFSMEEYLATKKVDFQVPDDVVATLRELITAANDLCKRNNVPALFLIATNCSDEGYVVKRSQVFPPDRTPPEFLISEHMIKLGLKEGLLAGAALVVAGTKVGEK